ncbi:adhesion G protein-coupled receptor E1 isoform X4 [Danio rerio]|uniref:Adhesion G protein-coupled receptor E1 isoform X4 n=1 Tax=Danio rerio TaxID=7955 RepID=A0AC58FZR3_DANRE
MLSCGWIWAVFYRQPDAEKKEDKHSSQNRQSFNCADKALQLMLVAYNIAIGQCQKSYYCSPLANTSTCANTSSYVERACLGQNTACMAYSCNSKSSGCSCKLGSYNCSINCNYDIYSDLCDCRADTHSCTCLGDMTTSVGSPNQTVASTTNLLNLISNMSGQLSPTDAGNFLSVVDAAQMKVSTSDSPVEKSTLVSFGNAYLNAFENLVSALVVATDNMTVKNIALNNTEVTVLAIGVNASAADIPPIYTKTAQLEIDLIGIAKQSISKSASVAFVSYSAMDSILKPDFFNTSENTVKTMMSTVISATLSQTNNTALTKPVNFTLKHIQGFNPKSSLSCVYWNDSEWIVDGCSVLNSNSSHTVCSCVHLSTFALIMQTSSTPPESSDLLELLNLVCVIVGLVFFSLALLSFALCQWSPGVNNVARINICISLLSAHLLFLLTQQFLSLIRPQQVFCVAIAGLLHFLFLSAFVWMFIEAVLLFICVQNLSRISSKKKEVLSSGFLCVIGYVLALVVVGVSIGLVPEGYGSEQCWIKTAEGFIWSFLGPVCVILALNTIFFIKIVLTLNSTLKNLNAEVSQMKQTKILAFKTLSQFVVLGCPWILGFFINGSEVLEILFLVLNSQQGTFIFVIYCVLNNEIMQQYKQCFRCLCSGHKKY